MRSFNLPSQSATSYVKAQTHLIKADAHRTQPRHGTADSERAARDL